MRTPWRFVADLVSRKPRAIPTDADKPDASEIKALAYLSIPEADVVPHSETVMPTVQNEAKEHEPAAYKAVTPPIKKTPIEDAKPEIREADTIGAGAPEGRNTEVGISDTEQVDAQSPTRTILEVGTEASTNDQAIALPEIVGTKDSEKVVSKPRSRTKQSFRRASPPADDVSLVAEAAPVAPKSLFEEMAELDAEIEVLRDLLARKLVEQNEQLKKMLDRFPG